MPPAVTNLARQFAALADHWSPRVVGRVNDQYVKVAKLQGEFVWHAHADEDELFLVRRGRLVIQLEDGRLAGGFTSERPAGGGGPLVVLFAVDLADAERRVREAGGAVVTPAFDFPGGRRFHFTDPAGNELAVWSDR